MGHLLPLSKSRVMQPTLQGRLLNSHLISAWAIKQFLCNKMAQRKLPHGHSLSISVLFVPTLSKFILILKRSLGQFIYIMLFIVLLFRFKDLQGHLAVHHMQINYSTVANSTEKSLNMQKVRAFTWVSARAAVLFHLNRSFLAVAVTEQSYMEGESYRYFFRLIMWRSLPIDLVVMSTVIVWSRLNCLSICR